MYNYVYIYTYIYICSYMAGRPVVLRLRGERRGQRGPAAARPEEILLGADIHIHIIYNYCYYHVYYQY